MRQLRCFLLLPSATMMRVRHRLNVVLCSPDIPGNTGSVGRTCMATGSRLHLVHPLGFSTSEKALRRAGMDYWAHVDVREHASWSEFVEREFPRSAAAATEEPRPPRAWLFTTSAERPHWTPDYQPGDYLLFGSETRGASAEVHAWVGEEARVSLPMLQSPTDGDTRSINLAAAASAGLYEAVRQISCRGVT